MDEALPEGLPEGLSDGEGEEGGASLKETFSGVFLDNDSEAVMSNKTGMQVVFLNGGGVSGGGWGRGGAGSLVSSEWQRGFAYAAECGFV